MAYFPVFVDMSELRVLLVGGGTIAKEKLEKLLDFTENISIISLEVNEEMMKLIHAHGLTLYQKAYETKESAAYDIVIVATNTQALHKEIYDETRGTRTLVNSVDNTAFCDFIFPSYVQKGELTVAFSTGGASPAFAKKLRQYFEKSIPNSVESFLEEMKELRKSMPKGRSRMVYFERLVETYFSKYFQ